LLKMGKSVRMINRSGKMSDLPNGVELVASDAYDSAKIIALTKDAACVYQCAQPAYYEWAQKFPALQGAILDAAIANGTPLVLGDNLYMYGHFSGSLREDSPVVPTSRKGKVRAEMAQQILDAHAAGKVRAAIGRASNFFGPYDGALTSFAIAPALLNKPVDLMGDIHQPHTFTYIKDFGNLLATLGTRPEALGQVWFAPSNAPISEAEFVKLLEAELGRPVKKMAAGAMMMRILGLFDKTIAESVEMMYEWEAPFVIDTSKASKAFGLQPTPLATAVRETVDWCKTNIKE
jgi:nucleoside-diphosphate-sugar epimerase